MSLIIYEFDLANVDSLCNQLERLFNGYMNHKEETKGKIYKNWDYISDKVRKDLNKIRKVKLDKFDINDCPFFINYNIPKFKIGQVVYTPENALGKQQPTSNFRTGDYRYSNVPRKITQILYFNDEPYFRYILEGIKNASYSEYQLIKSIYKQSRYKVKKIIDDRIVNNKREFLIWWDKYKKCESTFQKESELRKDGLGNLIDEYIEKKTRQIDKRIRLKVFSLYAVLYNVFTLMYHSVDSYPFETFVSLFIFIFFSILLVIFFIIFFYLGNIL